ncbi:MAG: OmpA family protein [Bacteroidales bacterium]|nr:OmpA family protein [Bacteroidales bacterium]MBR5781655.1 OmpA family protein [Bacteroidales bacterium]
MLKKLFLILIVIVLGAAEPVCAQRKSPSKSADIAFERKQYNVAIERYKKAYKKTGKKKYEEDRIHITYRLAECYRLTEAPKLAESQYKRLLRTEFPKENPIVYLNYADVLKRNQKYELAAEYYTIYNELVPDDPRGFAALEDMQYIKEWIEFPSKYEVTRLKKINSKAAEFGVAWVSNNYNEVIFSSTREGGVSKEKDAITGQSFADFYIARMNKQGEWEEAVLADEEGINSTGSEGTPFMNKNFSTMYFTRCPNHKKRESGCQIMKSSRTGSAWSEPVAVEITTIDSLDVVGHPTLSSDELKLFFASERKGGIGGKDIWMSERESTSEKFGRPRNIGEIINTEGDELYPYMRNDSTLYFASNGHGGMGGLDIYVTTLDSLGEWSAPVNLKSPINSIGNDYGITFHPSEERGFFISNRDVKNGLDDDIYYFIEPPVLFTISGTIKNQNSLQYVEGATVKVSGSDGSNFTTNSSEKGAFLFTNTQIKANNIYILSIEKKNFFSFTDTISTVGLEFSRDFNKDYEISVIPDMPIVLPDILYELSKWELRPQFEDSLRGLIELLQVNPSIAIELGSHTDSRDTHEKNDILSQRRAQSVCDYLVIRGIDPFRLTAKGYGERVPRTLHKDYTFNGFTIKAGTTLTEDYIKNLSNDELKEFAHQLNRRTEFRVISKDYIPRENISDEQMANVNMRPDDNKVSIAVDKQGYISFKATVNAYTENITYDKDFEFGVSQKKVMKMLNDGVITKDDFIGENIERIITIGAVADRAEFIIKEMWIANRSVKNVKVRVYNNLRTDWLIGEKTLKQFGEFTIDTETMNLIFNK